MAWLQDGIEEFKKLPTAGKIAVGVTFLGIAGIGFYEYKKGANQSSSTQGATSSSGLATTDNGNAASSFGGVDLSSLATSIAGLINTQPVNTPISSGSTTTGTPSTGTTTTTSPSGSTSSNGSSSSSSGSSSSHANGTSFSGPTGVPHYVANGTQTLAQIASKFGLSGSWNALYSIPDNQKIIGKKSATTLRTYVPKAGTVLSLPQGTKTGGGGPIHSTRPYQTIDLSQHIVQRYVQQPNGALHPQSFKVVNR